MVENFKVLSAKTRKVHSFVVRHTSIEEVGRKKVFDQERPTKGGRTENVEVFGRLARNASGRLW